ncbi:MAG: ATP synthase F1 subunit delta [Candidatus Eisenbacteria bacterium]
MSLGGGPLPRIYAGALFELARDAGALEERLGEARALLEILGMEPRFQEALASPRLETARKNEFVREVFGDRFSRDLRSLVLLLIEKGRQLLLREILEAFIELSEAERGRLRARVATAAPLTEEESSGLAEGLSRSVGKQVFLEKEVTAELLGGAVLRFGDYLVDGSLRRRIRELRETLLAPPGE